MRHLGWDTGNGFAEAWQEGSGSAGTPLLPAQEHLPLELWGGAALCPWGAKLWIHVLAWLPLQGCFFLVTSTMESKMSVVAGISFGIACFQVNLLVWLGRRAE